MHSTLAVVLFLLISVGEVHAVYPAFVEVFVKREEETPFLYHKGECETDFDCENNVKANLAKRYKCGLVITTIDQEFGDYTNFQSRSHTSDPLDKLRIKKCV